MKKNKILEIFSTYLLVLYPCLYLYFNNIGEAKFLDIIPASITLIIAATIVNAVNLIIYRNISKAVFAGNIFLFLTINFKAIESYILTKFPQANYWHTMIVILSMAVFIIILRNKFKAEYLSSINKLVSFIFTILLVLAVVQAIPSYNRLYNMQDNRSEEVLEHVKVQDANIEKPNFYYIILDEYGGPENLKFFMNYDNKDFYNFLENKKFNVSYSSRNKDIFTYKIVSDLVNLEFVSYDNMTLSEATAFMKNARIVKLFEEYGYKFNKITTDKVGIDYRVDYKNKYNEGENYAVETAYDIIINKTALYPFNIKKQNNNINILNNDIQYLYESVKIENQGIFSYAHLILPHYPFLFDEYGNANSTYLYYSWDNNVYLGQLKYTNKVIEKFVDKIIEEDPYSVVIIQSDHGSRNLLHRYKSLKERKPNDEEIEYMKSILNVVYYKGEKLDIEGKSGYETLKIVVNKILGTEIK